MDYQTLAPFTTDGQCGQYVSCTGCISDSSCGWCGGNCTKRTPNSSCVDATGHWRYMSHKQEQCMMCSDHFTCTECNKVSTHGLPDFHLTDFVSWLLSNLLFLVSAQADDLWLAFRVRSFVRAFVRLCVRNAKIFQRTYYLILI